MGFSFRKSKGFGPFRINLSKTGVSASTKAGPVTVNSRGRGSVRLGNGLSYRFGTGKSKLISIALVVVVAGGMWLWQRSTSDAPTTPVRSTHTQTQTQTQTQAPGGPFANCDEARAAGAAPLHTGDAGWNPKLDRDHNGVACA